MYNVQKLLNYGRGLKRNLAGEALLKEPWLPSENANSAHVGEILPGWHSPQPGGRDPEEPQLSVSPLSFSNWSSDASVYFSTIPL